ncbi:carboxymuconolactone decarboxylase family protein [Mycobacterium cookii]|nr:carboxymuconolactone decarboxylase family protein [Mycobacterium cookii]
MTPLPDVEWDDESRAALSSLIPAERANVRGAGNVLSTMLRHPALTAAYLPFNAYLLTASTLSPRTREVAVLRVVYRSNCDYLWTHHVPLAARAGLTTADIDGIRSGHCADSTDQLVIQAVDDLTTDATINQHTWDQLCDNLTHQQCMDLTFIIGGYLLLALAVNTFGIQNEEPAQGRR